jgi:putative addiction module component (TIGR02574 family)
MVCEYWCYEKKPWSRLIRASEPTIFEMPGEEVIIKSAGNFRKLRKKLISHTASASRPKYVGVACAFFQTTGLHISSPGAVCEGRCKQTTMNWAHFPGGIMSTSTMKRLSSEVLALPESERAELALELIRSLDTPAEEGVEEAWDREIGRRIAHIDSGQAKVLDRDEFRKRVRAKLGK